MFRGTIPAPMRSILLEHAQQWQCDHVYVGCSGNFTAERTVLQAREFTMHGNDVTLYSCALGAFYAGDDIGIRLKDEWAGELGWLGPYLETPADAAATVLLCAEMLKGIGSTNAHYRRIRDAYRRQWPDLHRRQAEKLTADRLRLGSFHVGDGVDWMLSVPDDQAVVCFPPFFAGDYEQMFKALDTVFDWNQPSYDELDEARRGLLLERMREKQHWFYGTHERQPDLDAELRGVVRTTNRGVPIYVYSSGGKTRIVQPRQTISFLQAPHLGGGDELGDDLQIVRLNDGQFTLLRSEYMNAQIKPGSTSLALAAVVDGKVVGAFAYSAGSMSSALAQWDAHIQGPHVYLLSDFPVRPTRYRHLAKLVLVAALSREAQLLIEQMFSRRYRTLITTANTNNHASMKYRGLFKLLTRRDAPDDLGYRFQLNYGAPFGEWSLAEGLELWKRRYAEELVPA